MILVEALLLTAEVASQGAGITWLQGSFGIIIVAIIGLFGIRIRSKREAESTLSEISQQELNMALTSMRNDITELRARVEVLEEENRRLEADNDRLKAINRTQEELIWGFTYWHQEGLGQWIEEGMPTPPGIPAYPWQVRKHLAEALKDTD